MHLLSFHGTVCVSKGIILKLVKSQKFFALATILLIAVAFCVLVAILTELQCVWLTS